MQGENSMLKQAMMSAKDPVGAATTSSSGGKNKIDIVHPSEKLQPGRILAATEHEGVRMFLMKWAGKAEADLIPAAQANILCPQVVIAFYEQRLVFHDDPNN